MIVKENEIENQDKFKESICSTRSMRIALINLFALRWSDFDVFEHFLVVRNVSMNS